MEHFLKNSPSPFSINRISNAQPQSIAVIGLRGFPDVIGGIETHCAVLYTALGKVESWPRYIIFMRRAFYRPGTSYPAGLLVQPLWAPKIFALETFYYSLLSLLIARFRYKAAIIHFHGIGPALFTPLARMLGAKVFVTHHSPDYKRPKWGGLGRGLLKLGERWAARYADHIICVSASVREEFIALFPQAAARTSIIVHGLEPSGPGDERVLPELGIEPGRFILAAGRFDRTKNFDKLIDAYRAAEPDMPLVIAGKSAGDVHHDEALAAQADENIIFAGFRGTEQMTSLFRAAALFVHPSQMEGFGLVVLEALQARAPMLLSDISPHREFGLPDDCYIDPDDIDALSARLAIGQPQLNDSVYDAIARRYDVRTMVEAYRNLYESTCRAIV